MSDYPDIRCIHLTCSPAYFETGQPYESNEGDAEAHAEEVHEGPVAGEDPDADHHHRNGHAHQLGQAEPTAEAHGDLTLPYRWYTNSWGSW